jgi:hypothetical protein
VAVAEQERREYPVLDLRGEHRWRPRLPAPFERPAQVPHGGEDALAAVGDVSDARSLLVQSVTGYWIRYPSAMWTDLA